VLEKVTDPRNVRLWEGQIPVAHRYTPGVAGEAFFRALRDRGEFLGSRCESCGLTYCPARLFCERCFSRLEGDTVVGPQGTVESFTVGYVGTEGDPLEEPVVLGLVRLDGADTLILHFLVEQDVFEIGQRVEPVLKQKRWRTGSILDVRGFRPANG
jgi:uncharacterized OB-fold protein